MRNISAQVASGVTTASVNGIQIDANQLINPSFHFVFSEATAAGTVKIQASNDIFNDRYQASNFTVTNWVDIPSATATVTAGAPALISLSEVNYRWLRVVFTRSAGAGTMFCNLNAVGV